MQSVSVSSRIPPAAGEQQGVVFDIQRCSLNDGPGIRTTVFLKGCPLRCQWCHNPESQRFAPQTDKAGNIYGRRQSVGDIMRIVLEDRAYYDESGGGLTISGGEPLAQPTFTLALLRSAQAEGIHTCLDTCGHVATSQIMATLPHTNIYHFDYKATGTDLHSCLCGQDGSLIYTNLRTILEYGASVILRCPLVPGVNDTVSHLQAIALLARNHPLIMVELLPYHNLGSSKSERFGMKGLSFMEPTEMQQQQWRQAIIDAGCPSNQITIRN